MGSNALRPEEWVDLTKRIQAGDPAVGADIAHRERVFDNIFQQISSSDFSPVITQGAGTLTYTALTGHDFSGYRVGPMVWLNFRCSISNSPGGAGAVVVTVPPWLPMAAPGFPTVVGTVWMYDASTGTGYNGQAIWLSGTTLSGWSNGVNNYMGAAGPAVALAINDQVSYNLQYITSAPAL